MMRKLELHINDMQFLYQEMCDRADAYDSMAASYRAIRGMITDQEGLDNNRDLVKELRRRAKCHKIVDKMREQEVFWR